MHRTAVSQKCKLLALGKWQAKLKQNMIPHNFFLLADHQDFLGVILKINYSFTRKANGDRSQDHIKKVIGPCRAGRFMSLTLGPHSINLYAYSKLVYRCNSIDLRIADINLFTKTAKSFLCTDLLEKLSQLTQFRQIEQGGLGLLCIQTRAPASLISTFLQTAINPDFNHTPLFWQPLTKGSYAGLVTLIAYVVAKIGIEKYLMDKFLKIHY